MKLYPRYVIILIFFFSLILNNSGFSQNNAFYKSFDTRIIAGEDEIITEKSFLIQINDKDSDWISDVEIYYNDNDKLEILEAVILDSHGKEVRKLKKKEIIQRSSFSDMTFHEDNLVKEFKLKWHEYPYLIKYSYRRTSSNFLHIANWYPLVNTEILTRKATLTVETPQNYKILIDSDPSIQFSRRETGKTVIYSWSAEDTYPVSGELFSPPLEELVPSVTVVPENFNYGVKGSFRSWTEYGEWQYRMNENLDMLTNYEKSKVDDLIKGIEDKREIIRKLYHYMQDNTRYINVSIDLGGLKPYPASYVCEKKYGDCKALTMYMKALLKYAGIDSYYTKIFAGANKKQINKNFPSQQFNHVILSVPVEGDTIWLENTSNILPFNYLGTFTQGRSALLVNKENSRIIKTPGLDEADVHQQNTYYYQVDKTGKGLVTITRNIKGSAFEDYKLLDYSYKERDQRKVLERAISINFDELLEWKFNQKDRDIPQIQLNASLSVSNQLKNVQDIIALKPPVFSIEAEPAEKRKYPLRINYPVNTSDSLVYDLDFVDQYKIEIPEDIDISNRFGSFRQSHYISEGRLVIKRTFLLFLGEYPLADYPEFYFFTKEIKESQLKSTFILKPI